MQFTDFSRLDLSRLPTPCFVVDEVAVERNLKILHDIAERSGAHILQALKAFSMFELAPLSMQYLSGTCSSGLHEARLAQEHYPGEIHVFAAGFSEADLRELLDFAHHIVFNSPWQLIRFAGLCREAQAKRPRLKFGLRINPEHSEGTTPIYDPCVPGSRLGTTYGELQKALQTEEGQAAFELISGLHMHTLCEQLFDPLDRTLETLTDRFGHLLHQLEWLNLGGGHHLSHPDYDVEALIERLQQLRAEYAVQLYLEPGTAVAVGTGVLVTEVLDISFNLLPQAILDTSATCHMPDTLEQPYRADILGAGTAHEKDHTYRLGGLTCLAGDVMGDYSFDQPLEVGQRLVFEDMGHYTMVKTTTFNGTRLPALAVWNSASDNLTIVKEFDYDDFKSRLS